ncbi:tail fiber domain-containing protein [Calothrix sp. FACHB-1219]|uniref:tail fiber domain-containing protein n=1 Tax=unclassified Calothrix TaxID=2619626 RepID=UPI001688858F|nr:MULTISPECIES: tail fiber domain-containing protein [unclassified Calothrix]MBD2203239.1 tail fiber domain-containing protein [Calothrix sp. FACHB-168]MBD2216465.1 tail fiber domain-containing protein [Calothrix sp. FACHB-1219]
MYNNDQKPVPTASLIEELTDDELANCVGGTGYINPAEQEIPGNDGTLNAPGLENNPHLSLDPNGSKRFLSDRHVKEVVAEVDVQAILLGIANLPITSWKYKNQDETIRHIGPMAQDFAAIFNCGESDRFINTVDANGVALAAIQALYQKLQAQDLEINSLSQQISEIKQHLLIKSQ